MYQNLSCRRVALLLTGLLLAAAAPADEAYQSRTILGTQPDLAEGARALQLRQFEEGVRLTLQGLKLEVSRRQRASGLSNLCAGYAALQRYDGHRQKTAEALGIGVRTLSGKLRAYGLAPRAKTFSKAA